MLFNYRSIVNGLTARVQRAVESVARPIQRTLDRQVNNLTNNINNYIDVDMGRIGRLLQAVKYHGVRLYPRYGPALKTILFIVTIWLIGFFRFSLAWPIFGLFIYYTQLCKPSNPAAIVQNGVGVHGHDDVDATGHPIDPAASSLAAKDPHVHFPDKERAEWVNKIIAQVWPYLDSMVERVAVENEKNIVEQLPDFLKSFRFAKVNLGPKPLRVTAVKCYEETAKEIILDVDVCYNGASEVEVVIRGLKAGLRNIHLTGVLRIELKPLLRTQPIIGGVNIYFLSRPQLSLELADVVEFLDVPMINELLVDAILNQVADYAVVPNKISIPIAPDVNRKEMRLYKPLGVLRFELFAARKLHPSDISLLGIGKSDAYANVVIQGHVFKTKTVKGKVSPKWDFAVEVPVYQVRGQYVLVEVMDEDTLTKDDFLGRIVLPLEQFQRSGQMEAWSDLKETDTGSIHFKAAWLTLSEEANSLVNHFEMVDFFARRYPRAQQPADQPIGSVALVCVYLDSLIDGLDTLEGINDSNNGSTVDYDTTYYVRVSIGRFEKRTHEFSATPNAGQLQGSPLALELNCHFLIDSLDQTIKFEIFKSGIGHSEKSPVASAELSTCALLEADTMTFDDALLLSSRHDYAVKARLKTLVVMRLLREPNDFDETPELAHDASNEQSHETQNTHANATESRIVREGLRQTCQLHHNHSTPITHAEQQQQLPTVGGPLHPARHLTGPLAANNAPAATRHEKDFAQDAVELQPSIERRQSPVYAPTTEALEIPIVPTHYPLLGNGELKEINESPTKPITPSAADAHEALFTPVATVKDEKKA